MTEKLTRPKFRQRLLARYFVRVHMTLILGAVILSGVISSKLLLMAGLRSMPIRYAIAVLLAYLVFFLMIRLWLWYVGISPQARDLITGSGSGRSGTGGGIGIDFGSGGGGSGWGGFGGGSSGGAGASDSWEGAGAGWLVSPEPAPSAAGGTLDLGSLGSSGGSGKGGLSLDFDDDGCLAVILLICLVALILAIFGSAAYLIYQAPAIFAEAAFQAALASGLIRASRGIDNPDWKGSVFKATWIPFVLILLLSVAAGWVAHRYCPQAARIKEVYTLCRGRSD